MDIIAALEYIDHSAVAPGDYVKEPLIVQLPASPDTQVIFTVSISDDVTVEDDESFCIQISSAESANVLDAQLEVSNTEDIATVCIEDETTGMIFISTGRISLASLLKPIIIMGVDSRSGTRLDCSICVIFQ